MTTLTGVKMAVRVPFVDLKFEYELLRKEGLEDNIVQVLAKAHYIEGPNVAAFEKAFAEYCSTKYCIAVDNGTCAIQLAMIALGIGAGDEVIVPAHTFIATAAGVAMANATPVFVDADPEHWQLDPEQIEARISPRTKAVIAVHLYGQPAKIERIAEICKKHGLLLIEDSAQAHGAHVNGRRIGSFGEISCFSFYPAKNLGAFGDGGGMTTNNTDIDTQLRQLRNHGRINKYEHGFVGYNYRMDEMQGLVLLTKLRHLDKWNEARRKVAATYREKLNDLPVFIPQEIAGTDPVYHLFPVACERRDDLAIHLAENHIDSGVHYPLPLHLQPAFKHLGYQQGEFPTSERIGREELSLPIYPFMTEEQVDHVCEATRSFFTK